MDKRILVGKKEDGRAESAARSAADVIIFVALCLMSAFILAALALIAPILLALSAIVGLLANEKHETGWRAAGA